MYKISARSRIRGNKVRVYSGAAYTLRFTATITAETGYVGFMAEKGVVCDLLRPGDAWYYEPYECFDITFPDGKQTTFGWCTRTGISWDNEFELFRGAYLVGNDNVANYWKTIAVDKVPVNTKIQGKTIDSRSRSYRASWDDFRNQDKSCGTSIF